MTAHPAPTSPAVDPVQLVDAAPGGRLVVIGSLPPHGRDLDLAARRRDLDCLDAALVSGGFLRDGDRYARFGDGTARVVELTVVEDWGLPEDEIQAMLDQARPLPGTRRLVRPAPAHVLLLLAPQCARTGSLSPGRRARVEASLQEDPGAWGAASRRAPAWHATMALTVLRQLVDGASPALLARIGALAQPRRATGISMVRAGAGAARRIASRPRRGAIVALSGVDGAGKSSQATALAAALEQLGEDPVIEWSRVRYDPLLATVGGSIKTLLRPLGAARSGTVSLDTPPPEDESAPDGIARAAPYRALDVTWALVSAFVDGYRHVRLCVPAVLRGKIVICDRYTLDTHVHLAERFSAHPAAARQAARLNRLISPRPLLSFWLDVPPDAAWLRKPDDVTLHRLREHAQLYAALHADHDATRLDAALGPHDVAANVARATWQARSL